MLLEVMAPLPAYRAVQVPFNIVNATVAYAVEDIVLGDLIYNKNVDFWWIDWQQGGFAGGMVRSAFTLALVYHDDADDAAVDVGTAAGVADYCAAD
jgi:hypothetical protein